MNCTCQGYFASKEVVVANIRDSAPNLWIINVRFSVTVTNHSIHKVVSNKNSQLTSTDPPSTVIEAKTLEVNWQVENNNTLLTFCI